MSNRHAELQALKQEIFEGLHCALPGMVESFDSESQTAVIRPALKSRSGIELPLLRDVPVFMPLSFTVSAGDHCLVVFADADIDVWLSSGVVSEPGSDRMHSLSDGFAFVGFDSGGGQGGGGIDPDDYYSKTETDTLLSGKSDTGHHHDSRYYTESETDTMLSGKSDTGHTHAAGDITSGTLPLARGGSGNTATGATTTIANIATAASGCEITTAQYACWGKVAMVRLIVKKTAAVTSGTTTLCTLVSGKRPKYSAPAQWTWHSGAIISSAGAVQVNGAISAGASLTILSTYILA